MCATTLTRDKNVTCAPPHINRCRREHKTSDPPCTSNLGENCNYIRVRHVPERRGHGRTKTGMKVSRAVGVIHGNTLGPKAGDGRARAMTI